MKVLHCPTTVGGNPQSLARAERSLGSDSVSVALMQNYLQYDADEVIFKGQKYSLMNELRRWIYVWRNIDQYDVIHYNYGQSLCPQRVNPQSSFVKKIFGFFYNHLYADWLEMVDVTWAKEKGKILAVTYQGDDARQGSYCAEHYNIHFCHEVGADYYNTKTDAFKRERIEKFTDKADLIYAVNPDLLNVLPEKAQFVPYASVDPREWVPNYVSKSEDMPLHIVHAPSNRDVKGTKYIVAAIERLRQEGAPLTFTLVEGVSNAEAKKIYESADVLVDQLLAGFYGGLSVELMALGKPVICYIRQDDMKLLPSQMVNDMCFINASPDNIYDVLNGVLAMPRDELLEIGRKSRRFVELWHDPLKIAAKLLDDYERVSAEKVAQNG